jgi:chemotaxis protein CheD
VARLVSPGADADRDAAPGGEGMLGKVMANEGAVATAPILREICDADRRSTTWARETPAPRNVGPGDVVVAGKGARLVTVLGSCVAVCVTDRTSGVGGMNHFLLPAPGSGPGSARHGVVALPRLLRDLRVLGCEARRMEAKIFGGAYLISTGAPRPDHLGAQNIQLARRFLREHGIRVVAEDVDGQRGRRLVYVPSTGEAWVRLL